MRAAALLRSSSASKAGHAVVVVGSTFEAEMPSHPSHQRVLAQRPNDQSNITSKIDQHDAAFTDVYLGIPSSITPHVKKYIMLTASLLVLVPHSQYSSSSKSHSLPQVLNISFTYYEAQLQLYVWKRTDMVLKWQVT